MSDENKPERDPRKPTPTQIVIWVVVGGVGLYFLGSGLLGILSH
ncbi:hypothetical protein VD659_12300 [Herbiconiux sp. 11R-BC]